MGTAILVLAAFGIGWACGQYRERGRLMRIIQREYLESENYRNLGGD